MELYTSFIQLHPEHGWSEGAEQCPVYTVCPGDAWSPHLNSSKADGQELSGNVALPEGCQALLTEDALHGLQDAMVLGRGVSGGELLNLELEKMGENIFHFTLQHWFKVSRSGIHSPVSQPMLRDDILSSHRTTFRSDWDVIYEGL